MYVFFIPKIVYMSSSVLRAGELEFLSDGSTLAKLIVNQDNTLEGQGISSDESLTLSGFAVGTPSGSDDLVNKSYVDSQVTTSNTGLQLKDAVRVASTGNMDLSSAIPSSTEDDATIYPIDGVPVSEGDRVLLKDQTDAVENGIYVVESDYTLTRSSDMEDGTIAKGVFCFVLEGDTQADTGFVQTAEDGDVEVGTAELSFTVFSINGLVSGTGIDISNGTVSFNGGDLGSVAMTTTGTITAGDVEVTGTITGPTIDGGSGPLTLTSSEGVILSSGLDVEPGLTVTLGSASDGGSDLVVHGDASVTGTTTASEYVTSSDRRLKGEIENIRDSLEKIQRINGVEFTWNADGRRDVGVIAQEIEAVLPEAVHDGADGYKKVSYDKLSALLIESIKAQQDQIAVLQDAIGALQGSG